MLFKSEKQRKEFELLNPNAQVVAFAGDAYMQHYFGIHLIITSVYRGNSGTHKAYNAFDSRNNMTKKQGDQLVAYINSRFKYGNGYQTIKDERKRPPKNISPNWTAAHLHWQGNYRKRDRGWG